MKSVKSKLIIAVMVIFGISIINSSCNKNEEVYSCDTKVNEWAIKNKESIKDFFISDVYDYKIEKQKAIYRIFSPKQRYELWADKLEKILSLKWKENEREHINLLLESMKISWFDFNNKSAVEEGHSFIKSWLYTAEKELKWKKDFLMAIGVSLNYSTTNNNRLAPYKINVEKGLPISGKKSCECSKEDPWCSSFDCVGENCDGYLSGCGWFGQYACDGICGVKAPNTSY